MRNDFEQLVWLYSIGLEDVAARQSINYFNVQIKNQNQQKKIYMMPFFLLDQI